MLSVGYEIKDHEDRDSNDQVVYENEEYIMVKTPYTLPGAIVTGQAAPALERLWFGNRFDAQQALYRSVFGSEEELFVRYEPAKVENLDMFETKIMLKDGAVEGALTYHIEVNDPQVLYFDCFGGRYTTRVNESENEACRIYVNDQLFAEAYPETKMNGILNLGIYENETVKVEVVLNKEVSRASFGVAGLQLQTMEDLCANARGTQITVDGRRISACVEQARAGETLVIMMPYSEGYTARINGEPTQVYRALSGFMCVRLESGENQIELIYYNRALIVGVVISVLGLGLLWLLKKHKTWLLDLRMRWVGVLPVVWFSLMIVMFYILPLLIARGGLGGI